MNFFQRILDAVFNRHPATEYSYTRSRINYGYDDARKDLCASDRKELQRLSRYFEAGNGIVNRMADLFEQYVVGAQGLQVFPASSSEDWNTRALAQYNAWKPFGNIACRDGFDTDQGRIARAWFYDGEVFVILTKEGQFARYQLVEAHRCMSPDGDRPNIHDGVEVDANGRPIAYWFKVGDTERLTRIDASYVVHVFEPSRPGQLRGIPFVSCVLNDLRDLDDLQLLEMRAAKHAAKLGIVQKNKAGEAGTGDKLRSRFTATNTTPTGASASQARSDYYASSVGSDVVVLQSGDEIAQFMTNRPTVTTREYWEYVTRKICAGVGIDYSLVFPSSMQGTVYRGSLDMANSFFRSRSSALAGHFQRIYEWVIGNDVTLISGRPQDWRATSVRFPRAVNVDVGRNSSAAINELAAGLRTYQGLYGEVGCDWKKELEQKAKEAAFIAALSLQYDVAQTQIAASGLPASEPEIEEDEVEEGEEKPEPPKETEAKADTQMPVINITLPPAQAGKSQITFVEDASGKITGAIKETTE